jgi:hypothetical protein
MNSSHHSWLIGQSHPTIGLVLIAIRVKSEYRYVSKSLSRWGSKGELEGPEKTIRWDE